VGWPRASGTATAPWCGAAVPRVRPFGAVS